MATSKFKTLTDTDVADFLNRAMGAHPITDYQKAERDLGEKHLARLLGAIGDPYIHGRTGEPRGIPQLWAYCGIYRRATDDGRFDDLRGKRPRQDRTSGAVPRIDLLAMFCIKQSAGEYRRVYDMRRAHTAVTHPEWTGVSSHKDAQLIVSKRILRDLWRAARDHHEGPDPSQEHP